MPSQWTFITLIMAAAVITLVSLAGVRIIGTYARVIGEERGRQEVFFVGLMAGLIVWPICLILALRLSESFRDWMVAGPFPFNMLGEPTYMVAFSALAVGGPLGILVLLQCFRPRRDR